MERQAVSFEQNRISNTCRRSLASVLQFFLYKISRFCHQGYLKSLVFDLPLHLFDSHFHMIKQIIKFNADI